MDHTQISVPELLSIIGDKEVQLQMARKHLALALQRIQDLEATASKETK